MGKIHWYLRRLFITFDLVFASLGFALIKVPLQSSTYNHELTAFDTLYLVWSWSFAIGVLGISCLGIYAAFSEKEIVLKIFAGFTVVVLIIMLIFGIVTVVTRTKFISNFDSEAVELAKSLKEDEKLRMQLDGLQQKGHCCGVMSASDWGDNIPNSCECSGYGYGWYGSYRRSGCKSKPQGVSGPDRIYAQPCSKVMFVSKDSDFETTISLYFGLSFIPLLCLVLSLVMIHQVRFHDGRTFHLYAVILRTPLTPNP